MGERTSTTKSCLQHWRHVSNILVTFYMNKIYYVLYIVKTLYRLLHVAPSQEKKVLLHL